MAFDFIFIPWNKSRIFTFNFDMNRGAKLTFIVMLFN